MNAFREIDALLEPLVQMIHRFQMGYDQEGYIE